MPVPTETLYNMGRLNRWFAVSGIGLLASFIYLVWEDYDRPWRGMQQDFMVAKAALAHLDYLDTRTESYQQRMDAAKKAVESAKQEVTSQAGRRAELEGTLKEEDARFNGVIIDYGNIDANVQVTRNDYEVALGAFGEDAPQTKAVREKLQREEAETAGLRKQKEALEDSRAALRKQIKDIDAIVRDAEKRLAELKRVGTDAAERELQFSNVLVKGIINAPLMDFTAPKGTAGREEVRQLLLPDVRQELNYLQTYTTDRCTTCHVAIDDPTFSLERLARRFEQALPAINEEMSRLGKSPLPAPAVPALKAENAPKLAAGGVMDYWELLSADQQRQYFKGLLDSVNNYLVQTDRKPMKLAQPLLAHPKLDLFVHVDSKHPMVKVGCTVCHEGNPQETDFVQAAHTPVSHEQEHEWAEKYYVTAAFIPNITFETLEHYWDRPMLPPKYSEAGCSKCHSRVADITEFAGESQAKSLNLGRDLFVRVGCVNCHNVDELGPQRKVAPDLTRMASKLKPEFVEPWVFHPKKFRPSTWMPHFFLQENNGVGSENEQDPNPTLRTESEVMAITQYLFAISKPFVPEPIPSGLTGDAKRGSALFESVGCLGCHANVSSFGRGMIVSNLQRRGGRSEKVAEALYEEMNYVDRVHYLMEEVPSDRDTVYEHETIGDLPIFTRFAPELSSIGAKASREWLFGWLKDPSKYDAKTRMPSLRLTDQEALDITEYLLTLKGNDAFKTGRFAQDDAHKEMVDQQVFRLLSGQNSARRSREIMDDQDGELTTTLVSFMKDSLGEDAAKSMLSGMDAASKRLLYLGNKMIAHYGCYACHSIGGFEKSPPPGTDLSKWGIKPMSQLDFAFFDNAFDYVREGKPEIFGHVYRPEDKELIYWSHGQNPKESVTHTHAAFARHKMLNPRIWDREKIKGPYDKLKMPNFYFTEKQADALVTYLLSRKPPRVANTLMVPYDSTLTGSIAEGRNLTRSLNCVGCHKIEDNAATVHQYFTKTIGGKKSFDEVNAPPWLRGEGAKVQYAWLYGFMNQVEMLRPWLKIRMPTFHLTEEETATLVKYFAGISQRESADLKKWTGMVNAHLDKALPPGAGDGKAPDPDNWFNTDALRDVGRKLSDYGVKNRLILSYDVDPVGNSPEDLKAGYKKTLKKTSFVADLFNVRFPFADEPRPIAAPERFANGEQLFYELKCLACHVLGDPHREGANTNPTAPNLELTHKRLRQEWVHRWLQEPSTIQPATKMPQMFADGNTAFAANSEEDRAALHAKYGATGEEQMRLLMDFIYNAGAKSYTALQPGGISGAGAATDGGDEEEEDSGGEEDEE